MTESRCRFYLYTAFSVRRTLGAGYVRPRLSEFRWALVRSNIGFGASGLAMIALSNLSVVIVSRLVIDELGSAPTASSPTPGGLPASISAPSRRRRLATTFRHLPARKATNR